MWILLNAKHGVPVRCTSRCGSVLGLFCKYTEITHTHINKNLKKNNHNGTCHSNVCQNGWIILQDLQNDHVCHLTYNLDACCNVPRPSYLKFLILSQSIAVLYSPSKSRVQDLMGPWTLAKISRMSSSRAWSSAFRLGHHWMEASHAPLGFGVGLGMTWCHLYIICCLEHRVLVRMYSRQTTHLQWWWCETSDKRWSWQQGEMHQPMPSPSCHVNGLIIIK